MTRLAAMLLAVMVFLIPTAPSSQTKQELEQAEQLAKDFIERRIDRVSAAFMPDLQPRYSPARLGEMRDALLERAGELRYIQAAYGVPARNNQSPLAQAAVPVDFQNFSVEILLTWHAQDPASGLTGLAIRPVSRRPRVGRGRELQIDFQDASYVNRDAFTQMQLRFGTQRFPLDGMLVLPVESQSRLVPGVLLLPDRDMEDADGTLVRLKPFRDLAHGLGSRGVASLRFPRRLEVHPGAAGSVYTVEEDLLADAAIAIRQLAARPEVDPKRIYILGYGFGALAAPVVANRATGVAGLIMVAPPARYDAEFARRLMEMEGALDTMSTGERQALEGSLRYLERGNLPGGQVVGPAPAAFWYSAAEMDPAAAVGAFNGPVLLLFGGKDYLTSEREYKIWGDLYRARRKTDLRFFPLLNRWLMPSQMDGNPEERNIPAHVAPSVAGLIAEFIHQN